MQIKGPKIVSLVLELPPFNRRMRNYVSSDLISHTQHLRAHNMRTHVKAIMHNSRIGIYSLLNTYAIVYIVRCLPCESSNAGLYV